MLQRSFLSPDSTSEKANTMKLCIFDLDNTLLAGDSDYAWGEFLVAKGLVDAKSYQQENNRFYEEYKNETLDIYEYQRFVFAPLMAMNSQTRDSLHQEFMMTTIEPLFQDKAQALIAKHKANGDTLLVITATNSFITRPIVEQLGIEHLLATEPEIIDGMLTGEVAGEPCFQKGKIIRLKEWLNTQEQAFDHMYFYSDSINDAPLLEYVDEAFAVDPDEALRALAENKGWPIISLRDSS